MTTLTCTDRDAIPVVLDAIQAQPGITKAQIVECTGIVQFRVKKVLGELVRTARASCVRTFTGAHWWPAHLAGAAKQQARAEAAERRRVHSNVMRAHRRRISGRRPAPERIEAEDDATINRWASVSDPLPFVCSAPASVFHLGGML